MSAVDALAVTWREQAAAYERDGLAAPAAMLRRVAGELETALRTDATETLTLAEAAAEVGRSYSTVQRAVRAGTIPNAGTKHRPRVRRCDLHRTGGPDLAGVVLHGE